MQSLNNVLINTKRQCKTSSKKQPLLKPEVHIKATWIQVSTCYRRRRATMSNVATTHDLVWKMVLKRFRKLILLPTEILSELNNYSETTLSLGSYNDDLCKYGFRQKTIDLQFWLIQVDSLCGNTKWYIYVNNNLPLGLIQNSSPIMCSLGNTLKYCEAIKQTKTKKANNLVVCRYLLVDVVISDILYDCVRQSNRQSIVQPCCYVRTQAETAHLGFLPTHKKREISFQ